MLFLTKSYNFQIGQKLPAMYVFPFLVAEKLIWEKLDFLYQLRKQPRNFKWAW